MTEDPPHSQKMIELTTKVRRFRHDPALIIENGVNPDFDVQDAYTHLAPMIDTDQYMPWLLAEARKAGCGIVEAKIAGPLSAPGNKLVRQYGVDAIVNCTGLGARELADDSVYPLRSALVRVRNDGTTMPRMTEAHCISHDDSSGERGFIFIVPRGQNMLVLGGLAEPNLWDLNVGLENYEPIREMYLHCLDFLPALRGAQIDAAEPVRRRPAAGTPPECPPRARSRHAHRPQLRPRRVGRHILLGLCASRPPTSSTKSCSAKRRAPELA